MAGVTMRPRATALWLLIHSAAALAPDTTRSPVKCRDARLLDAWAIAGVAAQSFYDDPAPVVRLQWAATIAQRFEGMRGGDLVPHSLVVAEVNGRRGDVVGCAEVGLLPAPPGFKGAAGTAATEASAAWRGVDIDDVSFRAPDVPTVANVAVAPRARRYGAGRAIVDAVAERLKTDASWRAWREFVSDEDEPALPAVCACWARWLLWRSEVDDELRAQRAERGGVRALTSPMRAVATPCTSYARLAEQRDRLADELRRAASTCENAKRRAAAAERALCAERNYLFLQRGDLRFELLLGRRGRSGRLLVLAKRIALPGDFQPHGGDVVLLYTEGGGGGFHGLGTLFQPPAKLRQLSLDRCRLPLDRRVSLSGGDGNGVGMSSLAT